MIVFELWFYVLPTATNIQRRDLGLKSHPKVWRSSEATPGPPVYKVGELCHYTMEASTRKGKILIRNSYNLWARLAKVKAINEVTLLNLETCFGYCKKALARLKSSLGFFVLRPKKKICQVNKNMQT